MLEILIVSSFVSSLTVFLNYVVKKIVIKRISKSNSAKESVKKRKVYRLLRLSMIIGYSVIIVVELAAYGVICADLFSNGIASYTTFYNIITGIVISVFPYTCMSLPISGMTMDDLKEKEFILFLRGFSSDSYDASMSHKLDTFKRVMRGMGLSKKADVQELPFSERDFCNVVKEYLPIYSVGMTKELESPEGSKRIYLDDATWQKDVTSLIEKAKYVFVLVHNSDSCIWEIQQCQKSAINKTVFFVDNPDTLDKLCKMTPNEIPTCLRINGAKKHCAVCMIDGLNRRFQYRNDEFGFEKLLNTWWRELSMSKRAIKIVGMCDYS